MSSSTAASKAPRRRRDPGCSPRVPATGTREEDFDWAAHVPQMTDAGVDADVAAAVEKLVSG